MKHVAVAAGALFQVAVCASAATVAPELLRRAARGERLEVFVVLREQPQAEIVQRVESASRLRLEIAEENYRRTAALPMVAGSLAALLRREFDDLVVEVRQAAFQEIEARIGPSQEAVARRLAAAGGGSIQRYRIANVLAATIPSSALAALETDPDVAEIFPVEAHSAQLGMSAPALGGPAFWEKGFTGAGESVAVIDSGIRSNHPAFAGLNVTSNVFGRSGGARTCLDDTIDSAEDRQGHGTHVAGIVASHGSPEAPTLLGVARGLGRLYNLKAGFRQRAIPGVCGGGAVSSSADVLEAIEWARSNTPVRIFNYSYGGEARSDDSGWARLLDGIADSFDVLFVIAAGNDGPGVSTVGDPSTAYNVLSVANSEHRGTLDRVDDQVARSSSRGPTWGGRYKPDIAAPGTGIRSASHESSGWLEMTGTSMAAPHIAGAAALLRQAGVVSSQAIKAVLINTADGTGWRPDWGWGAANLNRALTAGYYVPGTIGPASSATGYRLYSGSALGNLKATLVWKRHASTTSTIASTQFHNLDLSLYSRTNGQMLAQSEETVQNVEQLSSRGVGEVILKVDTRAETFSGGIASEPFVLAYSEGGFTAVNGPVLNAQCSAPPVVAPGAAFAVSCEVNNSGDLDAYNVSASLEAATGFRGETRALGNIASRFRVVHTLTFNAPPTAGRFPFALAFSGEAFGERVRATAQVTIATGSDLPAIAASAASLSLTHAAGGTLPGPVSIRLSNAGAGMAFSVSATSNGNWLAVSPASGTTPSDIRVSLASQRLTAGNYTGTVTVTAAGAANTPMTIPVTLAVTATPTVRLRQGMTTRNPLSNSACETPAAADIFLPTDREGWAWFVVDGVQAGDRASLEWRSPDGAVYATNAWNPAAAGGSFCYSGGIYIAGRSAADKLGRWKVRILWNEIELTALSFEIAQPVTVRESLMTAEVPDGSGCAVPARVTEYAANEKQAVVWFFLNGTKPGDHARAEWYSPDGKLFTSADWEPLSEGGERCFWSSLSIAGQRPATLPGTWQVKILFNDSLILTLPFRINPSARVEAIRMTRFSGELTGCREPDEVKEFHRRDVRAFLWYLVRDAKEGDKGGVEFYGPSGELQHATAVDPLPSGGGWCFRFALPVAGQAAASMFGDWEARTLWNGEPIASARFRVLPVEIADRMTAKSIPADYACASVLPTPASNFLPTDPQVHLYMFLKGAEAEETARAEWVAPNGEVMRNTSWLPLASAGSWCFRMFINLAGTPAAEQKGEWTIRVFWNEFPLFTQPFVVADPPLEGGAPAPATAQLPPRRANRIPPPDDRPQPAEPGPPR